jgi:hypothetical protein
LARTGIEYPFMKENRVFLSNHKEFEQMSECSSNPVQVGDYIRNDMEKQNGYSASQIIVYDCIDPSPFYDYDDPKD